MSSDKWKIALECYLISSIYGQESEVETISLENENLSTDRTADIVNQYPHRDLMFNVLMKAIESHSNTNQRPNG